MNPTHPIETHGRPIILIGLMGCGKTTIGKLVSKRTGMPLLDMDALIEEQVGKKISQIFAEQGEAHFRALETALLRYLVEHPQTPPPVISTGGGVVLRPENRQLLRSLGFVVWLNVSPHSLMHRNIRAANRPLLQTENPADTLHRLWEERSPLYRETAHRILNTSRTEVGEVCRRVCALAERFFAHQ